MVIAYYTKRSRVVSIYLHPTVCTPCRSVQNRVLLSALLATRVWRCGVYTPMPGHKFWLLAQRTVAVVTRPTTGTLVFYASATQTAVTVALWMTIPSMLCPTHLWLKPFL